VDYTARLRRLRVNLASTRPRLPFQVVPAISSSSQTELLAVAFPEFVHAPVEDHLEALREPLAPRGIDAACADELVQDVVAGHPRVELELAREIPAARVDRDTVKAAVKSEHAGAARIRAAPGSWSSWVSIAAVTVGSVRVVACRIARDRRVASAGG
jgi:hypothetical protein